jgi:hypothetical protein
LFPHYQLFNLFQSEIPLHPLHGLRLFPALSQIRQLLCSSAGRRGGIAEGRGSQDLRAAAGITRIWGFPKMRVPQNGWFLRFIMENLIKNG